MAKKKSRKWMQNLDIKEGGLHRSLNIPPGEPIPPADLEPKPGDSGKVKKQKSLAKVFKKAKKGKK
jgi:hypothetical protein